MAVSQLLGLTLLAATGAWLGRYRGGVAWQNPLQFNAHPLCMVLGMVFLQGDGEWKAPVPPGWVIEWVGRAREMCVWGGRHRELGVLRDVGGTQQGDVGVHGEVGVPRDVGRGHREMWVCQVVGRVPGVCGDPREM